MTFYKTIALLLIAPCVSASMTSQAVEPSVSFLEKPGQVEIVMGDQPLATYFYEDENITRPHFAHLRAPGGVQGRAVLWVWLGLRDSVLVSLRWPFLANRFA